MRAAALESVIFLRAKDATPCLVYADTATEHRLGLQRSHRLGTGRCVGAAGRSTGALSSGVERGPVITRSEPEAADVE